VQGNPSTIQRKTNLGVLRLRVDILVIKVDKEKRTTEKKPKREVGGYGEKEKKILA